MAPTKSKAKISFDKFKYFPRLPIEIRLMIWLFMMPLRVIKAEQKSMNGGGEHFKSICKLSGGPVPRVLHVCAESRVEALKHYTLIRSHAAYYPNPEKWYIEKKENMIWINFEIDTLYFINLAPSHEMNNWFRRLMKQQMRIQMYDMRKAPAPLPRDAKPIQVSNIIAAREQRKEYTLVPNDDLLIMDPALFPGTSDLPKGLEFRPLRTLKHIALTSNDVQRLDRQMFKLDILYGIARTIKTLQSITVVFDNGAFARSPNPHTYSFKRIPDPISKVKPDASPESKSKSKSVLVPKSKSKSNVKTKTKTKIEAEMDIEKPTSSKQQPEHTYTYTPFDERWDLEKDKHGQVSRMLRGFWENSANMGYIHQASRYREWRGSEEGMSWVEPEFRLLGICVDKVRRRGDREGNWKCTWTLKINAFFDL